jgi:competence protein ComGC
MTRTISLFGDERGSGFHLIKMLLFLGVASLVIAMLMMPMTELRDHARENAEGTEYENETNEMVDRGWSGYEALPTIAVFLSLLFALAMALILSSR